MIHPFLKRLGQAVVAFLVAIITFVLSSPSRSGSLRVALGKDATANSCRERHDRPIFEQYVT